MTKAEKAAEIRANVLDVAKTYVLKDRNATHGEPEDNFGRIADLWAAYKRVPFNATDVAVMMALMKIARIAQSPAHRDSWIDLAGYAACGAGIALQVPMGKEDIDKINTRSVQTIQAEDELSVLPIQEPRRRGTSTW